MIAALLIPLLIVVAILATATIAASLAKGLAAASALRRELATVGDSQVVTVRHERVIGPRALSTGRAGRRVSRPAPVLAMQPRQRAAA